MLAEAYSSLVVIKRLYDWDWTGAEIDSKRAIELDPNYATAHFRYAEHLVAMGRFNEAISEIGKALELDPLSPVVHVAGALVYYYARQYEKSREMCQKALELDPNFRAAHVWLRNYHLSMKNYDEYFSLRKKILILGSPEPEEIEYHEKLYKIYRTSGIEDATRYAIDEMKKAQELGDISPESFITPYVLLKDKEELINVLEECYEKRCWIMHLIKVHPYFDFIRSEPRFMALLKKMNLE